LKTCFLSFIFISFTSLVDAGPPLKRVRAVTLKTSIELDGRLNEQAWNEAGVIADLTQQKPNPGEPTPFHTEVRFLKNRDNLYIGLICTDPDPSQISIHTMKRDGDFDGDDHIYIIFDTFEDGRTGFVFGVNAAGARQDGLISDSERLSKSWDGIWNAKCRITDSGWTAEIVIPSRSLRFSPGKNSWHMEVKRYIARSRTSLRWATTSLDASRYDVRRAGTLEGMSSFNQGMGLTISPYGVAKYQQNFPEETSSSKGTGGFDIKYNLTPSLTAMLTVNTDFAETEVDNRRVNITRFSLFFPEKREFFLEGSNLFNFGAGLKHDFIPFYSRKIGLFDSEIIPIDYGVKILGKQGKFGIALLNVSTRDTDLVKGTNLFAGRVTYDLGHGLQVGSMVTDGNPDGLSDNTLMGMDLLWNTTSFRENKNLSLGAWYTGVSGDIDPGNKSGWGFLADYPNDLWDVFLAYKHLGEAMDPGLGFIPRTGVERLKCGFAYQPRPRGALAKYARQFFFECYFGLIKNLEGKVESWSVFTAPVNFRTPGGAHFEMNYYPNYEYLSEGFEVAEGIEIPAGEYNFTKYRIELESPESHQLVASTSVWFGDFYNGTLTQAETGVAWSDKRGRIQCSLKAENYFGRMPTGNFVERIYQLKLTYALNPDLILSSFSQYDNDSREIGTHNRIRWTLSPGRDVFFVWNYGWYRDLNHPVSSSSPEYNQLACKLRWTWRK
jgi:hypothetical protein